MRGQDCAFGAVGALEWCPTAVSVARRVLDNSPHSMLVGEGANKFAAAQGTENIILAIFRAFIGSTLPQYALRAVFYLVGLLIGC